MTSARLETCPLEECKGKVKRLLGTGAGFVFKGSGFYQTDYRSEAYKKAAAKESGSDKSGGEPKPTSPTSTDKNGAKTATKADSSATKNS